jgi:hypothetical protein
MGFYHAVPGYIDGKKVVPGGGGLLGSGVSGNKVFRRNFPLPAEADKMWWRFAVGMERNRMT